MLAHIAGHFAEGSAGEKNLVYTFAPHCGHIVMGDCPAAAAKNFDIVGAAFAQKIDNFRKKFDVPAVVARNPDRAHILLDRRAYDVPNRPMITEINDFDPMPDEFEIDCVDRAVVSVANRNSGKDTNR